MKTSISEVMETMFYLPVEFKEESTLSQSKLDENKPNMICQLEFSGDFSGYVTLLIPEDLLFEMTENFMGESLEHLENEHVEGTLTETLNMICGNALSRVDSKVPFELKIPKVIKDSKIVESGLFTIIETPQSMMAINITAL
ncbi:MAG: chemotaxis protein CheX [Thermodesulfobacteriota bacterium]|nr:chemotaxis protein CheX [Thermodesulfobacteriota bacterium]